MRDNGNIVCSGERRDLEQFCQTTHPHDVGLDDVKVTAFDELAESVTGVFVLAGGELHSGVGFLEESVAVEVIGAQTLLPPVNVDSLSLTFLDKLDSVGNIQ